MHSAANLFPWDIVGDPAAPELLAGLGVDHVVLAAAYHATRAVTPRHPSHRVVTAPYSAAYYVQDGRRWHGREPRLGPAPWAGAGDAFEQASTALNGVGVPVHAWVVVNHVDLAEPVSTTVVNAYGDRYPWALCPAQNAVLEYAVGLAAEVAMLPGIAGVELEACGWFGVDHPGAHDKTGAVPMSFAERYLLSLCFCDACTDMYVAAGISSERLRDKVRYALEPAFAGCSQPQAVAAAEELAEIDALLDADLATAVATARADVGDRFRAAVVGAIRNQRAELTVLLHANPRAQRGGSFTGVEAAAAARHVDGLVVNCWSGFENLTSIVDVGVPVAASLLAATGLGGHPHDLAARVASAQASGAAGVRFYHVGLATDADLAGIREANSRRSTGAGND
jgi:hypothetical protein